MSEDLVSPSPYLTTPEAAAYLRRKPATLERWRCQGTGPRYRKHGGRVLYTRADLDVWSETQARTSTAMGAP